MLFKIRAQDRSGQSRELTLDAASAAEASEMVAKMELVPLLIEQAPPPPPPAQPIAPPTLAAPLRRGPASDSGARYTAASFATLFLWGAILLGLSVPLAIIFIGFLTLIAACVLIAIMLYRSWDQIQDGHQRTTPILAVALMFIPLFNLYWQFVAIYGLAQDSNAFMKRNNIACKPVSTELVLTSLIVGTVMVVTAWIPILNILIAIAAFVLHILALYQLRTAAMAIAQHRATVPVG